MSNNSHITENSGLFLVMICRSLQVNEAGFMIFTYNTMSSFFFITLLCPSGILCTEGHKAILSMNWKAYLKGSRCTERAYIPRSYCSLLYQDIYHQFLGTRRHIVQCVLSSLYMQDVRFLWQSLIKKVTVPSFQPELPYVCITSRFTVSKSIAIFSEIKLSGC